MKKINNNVNNISLKALLLLFCIMIASAGCTGFQLEKSKMDEFAAKNLMLQEKQELTTQIILAPDSLEKFVRSSFFYDSLYSDTFFKIHMFQRKVKKVREVVSDNIKLYKYEDFTLSKNQTYIIGPDKENWEYFHQLEYKINSKKHSRLIITFVLKDKKWYFVEMFVEGIYEESKE